MQSKQCSDAPKRQWSRPSCKIAWICTPIRIRIRCSGGVAIAHIDGCNSNIDARVIISRAGAATSTTCHLKLGSQPLHDTLYYRHCIGTKAGLEYTSAAPERIGSSSDARRITAADGRIIGYSGIPGRGAEEGCKRSLDCPAHSAAAARRTSAAGSGVACPIVAGPIGGHVMLRCSIRGFAAPGCICACEFAPIAITASTSAAIRTSGMRAKCSCDVIAIDESRRQAGQCGCGCAGQHAAGLPAIRAGSGSSATTTRCTAHGGWGNKRSA